MKYICITIKNSQISNIFFCHYSSDFYKPLYTPQAPPGGKSSMSFGYDEEVNRPNTSPNTAFQE
jgi:hypothetical protein